MKTRDFLKMTTFAALASVPVIALKKNNSVDPEYHYITQQLQKTFPNREFHEDHNVPDSPHYGPQFDLIMDRTVKLDRHAVKFSELMHPKFPSVLRHPHSMDDLMVEYLVAQIASM